MGEFLAGVAIALVLTIQGIRQLRDGHGWIIIAGAVWIGWNDWASWANKWTPTGAWIMVVASLAVGFLAQLIAVRKM